MRAVKHMVATAKAPDKTGSFDGVIFYNPPEGDSDGERVENFTNTPTTVPLDFQHLIVMDPGSVIGQIKAVEVGDGKRLAVQAQIDIGTKMADAVHERMLLPDDDPMVLKELSIAYAYDPSKNTRDKNGVVAIHDAELIAISVVHAGAQQTKVMNVKSELDVLEKTALAGLITVEQAIKYAEDLGVPGDISQELFKNAATDGGTSKAADEPLPPLAKTIEEMKAAGETEREVAPGVVVELKDEDEKDLAGKPWHIEEQNGKYCVIKDSDGSTAGCHDTRGDAVDQIRALYASEKSADDVTQTLNTMTQFYVTDPEAFKNAVQTWSTNTENSAGFTILTTTAEEAAKHLVESAMDEKAGRVIGSKRVADLKASLGAAIDEWAKVVNGDLATEDKADEVDEKAQETLDLQAQLDELVADQTGTKKSEAEAEKKARELEEEIARSVEEKTRLDAQEAERRAKELVDEVAETVEEKARREAEEAQKAAEAEKKARELEEEIARSVEKREQARIDAEKAIEEERAAEEIADYRLRLDALEI